MALSAARNTRKKLTDAFVPESFKIAGSTTIYKGALCAINASGYLVPFSSAENLVAVGRACQTAANPGSAGAASVEVEQGTFLWNNAGSGAVTQAHVGLPCYGVDDETVSSTGTNRSVAGVVIQVADDGVWVKSQLEIK